MEKELDLSALEAEFEAEFAETEEEVVDSNEEAVEETGEESEAPTETEQTEEVQSEDEESSDEEENVTTETEEDEEVKFQTQKQNRAFADLRRKAEANEKYAGIIQKIAEANGVEPDEIVRKFEEQQIQKEAEDQNVPVDVLKRIKDLEEQNKQLAQETWKKEIDGQIQKVKSEYNASDDDIRGAFEYATKNNIPPQTPFEQVYKLANLERITEMKIQEARQKELAAKKKRQSTSAITESAGSSPTNAEDIDKEVENFLKEEGII